MYDKASNRIRDALPVGTCVGGRYEVLLVLGGGKLGIRYACADGRTNRSVALREFFPNAIAERAEGGRAVSPKDGACGSAFVRGADCFYGVYSALTDVVGSTDVEDVRDCFFENGTAYAVSDLYTGMRLSDYLVMRPEPLTEGELCYLADALSDALIVVHSLGLVHGDIRAENVFLRRDGTAKLIDFGGPRYVIAGGSVEERPEADIRALGKMLYAAGAGALIRAASAGGGAVSGSASVAAAVLGMLEEGPRAGFSSVLELKHAINCIETSRVRPAVPADLPAQYEKRLVEKVKRERKKMMRIAVFAAVLLALVGTAVYLYLRR